MKKINAINSMFLIALIILMSLFLGCGDSGGGGSISPQAVPGGPSLTIEGELDRDSLGADAAFDAAAASRLELVVVDNAAYKTFREEQAASAGLSAASLPHAPQRDLNKDFYDKLKKSVVTIFSSGSISRQGDELNFKVNIPLTNSKPDCTLMVFDKETGGQMLSTALGRLPDKNDPVFVNSAASGSGSIIIDASQINNIKVNNVVINGTTTAGAIFNIENNLCSDIGLLAMNSVKKYFTDIQSDGGNITISSSNGNFCNSSVINNVINNAGGSDSIFQIGCAVKTINKTITSSNVSIDDKSTIVSNFNSSGNLIAGTLNGFVNCIANPAVINNVAGLPSSINIGGTLIDARSTPELITNIQSNVAVTFVDSRPPTLLNIKAFPASASAGENINLAFKSDVELAANPAVYICGRPANVFKTSSRDYTAWVEVVASDSAFAFSIDSIIGANGKQGLAVSATTDGSLVTILKTAAEVLAPVANPPAGDYEDSVAVEFSTKTPGAEIYYTFSANTPPIHGTKYSAPIMLQNNSTSQPVIALIRAVAVLNGKTSTITTVNYRIMPRKMIALPPFFSVPGGQYNRSFALEIFSPTIGAQISYTLDGTLPSKTNGTLYSSAVNISKSVTLKAMAFNDGMEDSRIVSVVYQIDDASLERVSAPVIRPATGAYDKPQAVSISCATPGASIRYTLDGSVPTFSEGAFYSSSFMLGKNTVVNAIAFKAGMADSDISRAVFEITGEVSIDPPSVLSEMEPKFDGAAVNSDFDLTVNAASGWRLAAEVSGVNVLNGAVSVTAVNNMAVLPVNISKLVEGRTCEIKITAAGGAGESKGELSVRVKKDTVAPRRDKLSAASSNAGGPSIAELGDRIVISLSTDEPVKNLSATIMNKPVTIRNTDSRNWTVARYLDGSEDSDDFDFIVNFTDLAGNSVSYPLTKKEINEGEVPVIKKGSGNSSFNIFRKTGVNKLYLSAVPGEMEYCLDGVSEKTPVTWYSGAGADVDLSGVSGDKYIFVRQKGFSTSAQCLGKITAAPIYGIDELKSNNRWAFDASSGSVILTGFNDGLKDLDESMFSIHIYSGASSEDGTLVMQYYMDKVESGYTGKVTVPSFIKSSWTGGEFVSFYLKSNNGTPYLTEDDVYIQPVAGVAVKWAPVNSSVAGEMNFIYDGRSNQIVFQGGATAMAEITPLVSIDGKETVRLNKSTVSGASRSFELPFQPSAGAEISIALEYKDGSVSGAAKFMVAEAPGNMAEGFGNFSVKALLGQIAVTNFDSGRDGYTAFASTDNGFSWKELGKISADVGQNFNITMTASGKIKLAMRDKSGNFSLTQQEGVSLIQAPVNTAAGDKTFTLLGHEKKLEVDNSNGSLNGFNLLYSLDGGASWSSTEAVSGEGRQKISLPEFIRSGSEVKIALLEWKTGNASFASAGYILKSANNITSGATAGDYTVNASLKKVSVNNKDNSLNGNLVYINGMQAGKIGSDENIFSYSPRSSDEVELYYAEPSGNTWLVSKSKPVVKPRNNKLADGDFFVDAFNGKITFKNSGGAVSGLTPLISTDGGHVWKDIGAALTAGDKEFTFAFNAGDEVAAVFMDSEGNTGAASEVYNASGPKLNTPVKMLLAGDGGAGAKAGVIEESGKLAVTIRPGVTLKNGESLKVTLSNGGAVSMTAKASVDGVIPVFGGSTPGVTYEAGAAGNGNAATGSFNLNNTGGTPVSIIGTIEVAAVHTDILGNISPVSKAYITADTVPPSWAAGYPAVSASEYFKLNAGVRINEDGRIYLLCLKSTEPAPAAAQVKLGQNASGAIVAAGMKAALDFTFDGGALTHEFAGLDNNSEYALYAVAEDLYENLQAQPAVVKMKTLNNIAPIWAADYPKVEAPAFNQLSAAVKMNETGSVYLVCLKSGAAALSAAQVKAGTDASGAALNAAMKAVIAMTAADSEAVHIFAGLESAVEYDIYAVAEDEYGELQANPTVTKIKTIDDLPPVWSSGYPQGQPTGYTSLRLSASVDKKSIVYAVCLSSNAPEPSVAQVIAGRNALDIELAANFKGTAEVAANTTGYINFINLGVGTPYDIYSAAVNEYGVAQTAVTKTRAYTIALVPLSVSSVETSTDGTKILVKFNKTISSTLPAAPGGFTVTLGSSYNDVVTGVALSAGDKTVVELTLTKAIGSDISSASVAYTRGASGVKCLEGFELSNFSARAVTNKSTFVSVLLLKDAAFSGNEMVLTPAAEAKNGVAMFENKVDVTKDFTVDFTFKIENPSDSTGADGIIFMATKYSPSEIQAMPSGSWVNSYINNFLYVDFDTYRNDTFDTQAHSISIKYPANQKLALGTAHYLNCNEMVRADYGSRRMATWNPGNTTTEFHGTRYVRINYTAADGVWKVYYSQSAIAGEGDVKITHTYKLENLPADNSKIELVDGKYLYLGVSGITGASWEKHSLTSLTISN